MALNKYDYDPRHELDPILQDVIDEGSDARRPITPKDYMYLGAFLDNSSPVLPFSASPREVGPAYAKSAVVLELDELLAVEALLRKSA